MAVAGVIVRIEDLAPVRERAIGRQHDRAVFIAGSRAVCHDILEISARVLVTRVGNMLACWCREPTVTPSREFSDLDTF